MFPSPSGASILIQASVMCSIRWILSFHLLPEHQFLFKGEDGDKDHIHLFPSPSGASILIRVGRMEWVRGWFVSISFRSINSYSVTIFLPTRLTISSFHLLPEHQFLFGISGNGIQFYDE